MKIAMLVPGGVDRSGTHRVIPCLLWMIERLAKAGHEVHVFALDQEPRPGRWPLLGATVHNAGSRPRRLRMLIALRDEHRRAPFDVIHAFWAAACGTVAGAARAALGVPVVLHLPGGDLADRPEIGYGGRNGWRGRLMLRLALSGADRVVAPSGFMVREAAALGIEAERLPYGVALDRWPPSPPRPREAGAPARLVHVGSLNAVKDQPTLLRAAARLLEWGIPFHLDIVGEDTLGGAVQRLARDLGLAERTTFHGFVPQDELRRLLLGSDLLLVSSRHEAGPIVVLEAAACGVPAVGTCVGHLADWAPEAAVGVPVGDADALAAQARALLADEPARLRLASRAQERAAAEDADYTARRLIEISESVRRRR